MEQCKRTKTGIPVYFETGKHLHSFCISLYLKAGVLYEEEDENGITHFLEHMFFRNLNGIKQQELYRMLQSMGAEFNAYTYQNLLYFYISATPAYFNICAKLITDLLAPMSIEEKDLAVERKRICSEIREEDIFSSLDYQCEKEVYKGTPLIRPIAGTVTKIKKITADRLCQKQKEIFQKDNMFFYVSGHIDETQVDTLTQLIETHPLSKELSLNRTNVVPIPKGFCSRNGKVLLKEQKHDTQALSNVVWSFDLDMTRYTQEEIDLLYAVLFFGELGRFKMELSERCGLIYDFDPCCNTYSNLGNISVSYCVAPSALMRSLEISKKVFQSMIKQVTQEDLDLILPEYKDNNQLLLDAPEKLSWHMAYQNHIMDANIQDVLEEAERYAAVSPQRLMDIAREVFTSSHLVLAIRADLSKLDRKEIRNLAKGM